MRSTGRAVKDERCDCCGKPFREGEQITEYWQWAKLQTITCRNSVACEKRMAEQAEENNVQTS